MSAIFFTLLIAAASGLRAAADERAPPTPALIPLLAAAAPSNVFAHRRAKAPADEYFGRFRLSILGVRNVIAEIDTRADNAAEDVAQSMCHKLILVEDALRDWQAKYPDDAWVPKFGYAMLKDYEKIDADLIVDESRAASVHAIDLANWLESTYPNSEYAHPDAAAKGP